MTRSPAAWLAAALLLAVGPAAGAPPNASPAERPADAAAAAPAAAAPAAAASAAAADEAAPPAPRPRRPPPAPLKDRRLDKAEQPLHGGTHWRLKSERGPIHVWIPPGYDRGTAGVVVYVHGYHTDVDGAWKDHDLAAQFKASRQNAMFVVPEAPSSRDEAVHWPALADLRKAVRRGNLRLPAGPTVVIGHSGAFRTLARWIDHKAVSQMILLDALYGEQEAFAEFIADGERARQHRLILVSDDTVANARAFAEPYRFAVTRKDVPESVAGFSRKEKRARLLHLESQHGHMKLVTDGTVIPLLLRLTPLRAL